MSEEKKHVYGFRMKWADREIEYYGDAVKEIFKEVFEHLKTVPITYVQTTQAPTGQMPATTPTTVPLEASVVIEDIEYERLANDAKVSRQEILEVIEFRKTDLFPELIPFLPKHPDIRDAILLASYAMQVGLQKNQVQVSYLKKVLKGPNGYPMPGREFGLILEDLRKQHVIIASGTQKRNKPFSLSSKGLGRTRKLIKT